jgi:hypothetical protein
LDLYAWDPEPAQEQGAVIGATQKLGWEYKSGLSHDIFRLLQQERERGREPERERRG